MELEGVVCSPDRFCQYGCMELLSMANILSHDYKISEDSASNQKVLVKEDDIELGYPFQKIMESGGGFHDHQYCGSWDSLPISMAQNVKDWDANLSPPELHYLTADDGLLPATFPSSPAVEPCRRKRRKTKRSGNEEDVKNQRMTHIAVERNRRKQMNEYLALIRSLMPPSYVKRGDQASIVGGAISFVKELEQHLQSLEANKRKAKHSDDKDSTGTDSCPFADFFTFPQYSTFSTNASSEGIMAENRLVIADIEVTMVERHASFKVLSKKRPKQLLKMVVGFTILHLTILHLNLTSLDEVVLYSFSVKVEEECKLNSVDEIAAAVNQMLHSIQNEEDHSCGANSTLRRIKNEKIKI